jgi:hypothetical protein
MVRRRSGVALKFSRDRRRVGLPLLMRALSPWLDSAIAIPPSFWNHVDRSGNGAGSCPPFADDSSGSRSAEYAENATPPKAQLVHSKSRTESEQIWLALAGNQPMAQTENIKEMVPRGGIEPPTLRFSVALLFNDMRWLCRLVWVKIRDGGQ